MESANSSEEEVSWQEWEGESLLMTQIPQCDELTSAVFCGQRCTGLPEQTSRR